MAIFIPEFANWQEAFEKASSSLGIVLPKNIIDNGKINRFSANGKKGNSSGWYVVFHDTDISGGVIGNWGTGEKINWHYSPRQIGAAEKSGLVQKWHEAKVKADAEREELQKQAAIDAKEKWDSMQEAMDDHDYLIKKGIRAHGLKVGKERLYMPLYDEAGQIASLQSIDAKGQKLFMQHGRVKGCYFLLGSPTSTLLVAEGYATAASLYEATGTAVAVALNSGNLDAALFSLKERFPMVTIMICADSDPVGMKFANEAADKHGCKVISPAFTDDEILLPNKPSDFNDYANLRGMPALTELFKIKESQPSKFSLLSYDNLIYAPKVQWVIENTIPKNSFGVIYGVPGKGKTFSALDMALCVAHGLQWHDLDVCQGSVLYVAQEGMGGIAKRLKAWTYRYAKNEPSPPFYAIAANVNLTSQDDVNELVKAVSQQGSRFSMIFIDTVARSILGADENSSTDMGLFVAACDQIKEKTGATVIGVHHSGKDADKGMRGSSALLGAVDTVIQVSQEDEGIIVLKNEKQKDAELFKDMVFNSVVIATGIKETSLILEPSKDQTVHQKPATGNKADLYVKALMNCIIGDKFTLNNCPATKLEKWRSECDNMELGGDTIEAKKQAFWRAKKRMQEQGKICVGNGLVSYLGEPDNG